MIRPARTAFCFYLSCDINLPIRVRISDLQGKLPSYSSNTPAAGSLESPSAVSVAVQLTSASDVLGLEARTTYVESSLSGCVWGEWLTLCIKYRDLPHDAQLCFSIWEMAAGTPLAMVGGTTLPLFNKKGRLKTGPQRLKVWEGRDPCTKWATTTPGKVPLAERSRLGQLEHLVKAYNRGDIQQVDWLDALTKEEVRRLQQQEQLCEARHPELQLVVDLPAFPQAVLYQQPVSYAAVAAPPAGTRREAQPSALLSGWATAAGAQTGTRRPPPSASGTGPVPAAAGSVSAVAGSGGSGALAAGAGALAPTSSLATRSTSAAGATEEPGETQPGALGTVQQLMSGPLGGVAGLRDDGSDWGVIVLQDAEVGRDNPAELKAQKLARSLTRGVIDRDLKPNSDERRRIAQVLKYPPNRPVNAEERALLWRFRFSLTQETRALTKFLKCVDWGDALEAKQAAELMQQWTTIDIADALELLSPDFKNDEVRSHAVSVLMMKDDDELMMYLLQLVQALRYEASDSSRLAKFLVQRAVANPVLAIMLNWFLYTECTDPAFGGRANTILAAMMSALQRQAKVNSARAGQPLSAAQQVAAMAHDTIQRQTEMMKQMAFLARDIKTSKLKAARATQRLQEMVSESGACGELTVVHVPLPLDPSIMLTGIVPSECMCFKSAQLPLCLSFKVDPSPINWKPGSAPAQHDRHGPMGEALGHSHHRHMLPQQILASLPSRTGIVVQGDNVRCVMIYKKGDDLRQDQFILQMISLMDRLLKRENLDLRLTPYKVLPTSPDDGLVEFVASMPLSRVLSEHRTIHRYLGQFQADSNGPFYLKAEAVETFVRSCAGYCVATYILGVGDRHLDNLMLTQDGRLFHIDFGYILGNDPKPFPPPMKLCKEMVEAMGGPSDPYYVQFRMYACEAYNILRKSADLILSLFHLMAGASIEAIRQDPEKAILKLQEKFRLDMDDEQAVEYMQQLINESATALMPQIVETTHRWAQLMR